MQIYEAIAVIFGQSAIYVIFSLIFASVGLLYGPIFYSKLIGIAFFVAKIILSIGEKKSN